MEHSTVLNEFECMLNAFYVKKGCLLQKVASKTDTEDDNKEIQRLDNEIDKIMSTIDTLTK